MNTKKIHKKPQFFILKMFLLFYKVFKFALIAFLYLFSTGLKRKKPYQPTLQEQMLGENIPFSDQYYIPDDHYHR